MDDLARDRPSASERRAHVRPWWRTPEDAVPVILPIVEPLVRAPAVAITLVGAHVYREGLELRIERRMRRLEETEEEWQSRIRDFLETRQASTGHGGPERLRYSVITADEEVFANSLFRGHASVEVEPSGLSVMRTDMGASGDPWRCESNEGLWLWPLPAADRIELVVRWPAVGISRESVAIDTPHLIEISQQSRPLWSGV